jgi:hypothetical protein
VFGRLFQRRLLDASAGIVKTCSFLVNFQGFERSCRGLRESAHRGTTEYYFRPGFIDWSLGANQLIKGLHAEDLALAFDFVAFLSLVRPLGSLIGWPRCNLTFLRISAETRPPKDEGPLLLTPKFRERGSDHETASIVSQKPTISEDVR